MAQKAAKNVKRYSIRYSVGIPSSAWLYYLRMRTDLILLTTETAHHITAGSNLPSSII